MNTFANHTNGNDDYLNLLMSTADESEVIFGIFRHNIRSVFVDATVSASASCSRWLRSSAAEGDMQPHICREWDR